MSKHILLVFNMGNSGGKYIEDICNTHEDVQVWQEANHFLEVDTLDVQSQLNVVYNFFKAQYQISSKKTIGLIKAFDDRLIRWAEESGGSIIQTFRHPIGVVNFKAGHKIKECEQRGKFGKLDTPEKIFEAHVEFYASRYQNYTENADKWPVIKLESLKESLRGGPLYFENLMRDILKVDWQSRHTEKVINMGGLEEDFSHFDIWQSWDDWKRNIFLSYFQELMELYGYEWEK